MNLNNYNNNSLVANCELDNIKLTQDFVNKMYLGILPKWDAQVIIFNGGSFSNATYTTPDCGYIQVRQLTLDEKTALNMWFNERQVLAAENPTTYYRAHSLPQFRVKKGVVVKINGGYSGAATIVTFIPIRRLS